VSRPVRLGDAVVHEWLEGHPSWRLEHGHLVRELRTKDYPGAVALVAAQVPLAEGLDHHPVASVGYRELRLELWTHDQDGITQLDLDYGDGFDVLVHQHADLLS
jgi:4a-hydroxytetrahydrobiopterin dehydratase